MQQDEYFNAHWSRGSRSFPAFINSEGRIITNSNGGQSAVGVTLDVYDQMEKLLFEITEKAENYKAQADDYHQQLVDAGLIIVPPSDAERIDLLTNQVAQLTETLQKVLGENNGRTSNGKGSNSKREQVEQSS